MLQSEAEQMVEVRPFDQQSNLERRAGELGAEGRGKPSGIGRAVRYFSSLSATGDIILPASFIPDYWLITIGSDPAAVNLASISQSGSQVIHMAISTGTKYSFPGSGDTLKISLGAITVPYTVAAISGYHPSEVL